MPIHSNLILNLFINKTGLQPVSGPVELVHGARMCSKNV